MAEKLNVFQLLLLSTPILLNAALIVWVALVGPTPKYGVSWIFFPIMLTFPLVGTGHIQLGISFTL